MYSEREAIHRAEQPQPTLQETEFKDIGNQENNNQNFFHDTWNLVTKLSTWIKRGSGGGSTLQKYLSSNTNQGITKV